MKLEFDATPEDLKVFLDEAEEQLQLMEEDFVKLEQDPANSDLLQEIFRAAHTLKGSSATLGHARMAELTHHMENVLDRIRRGQMKATSQVVDVLFNCLDALKVFKEEIATGQSIEVDLPAVLRRLNAVETAVPGRPAAPVETGAAASGAGRSARAPVTNRAVVLPPLEAVDAEKLARGQEEGLTPWYALVELDRAGPMPSVRAFQVLLALGDMSRVVRSWPSHTDVEQDRVGSDLKVVFLTDKSDATVRDAIGAVPEVTLCELLVLEEGPMGAEPAGLGAVDGGGDPEARLTSARRTSRTVRVDVELLDNLMNLVGELVIDRTRLGQIATALEDRRGSDEVTQDLNRTSAHIGRATAELQEEIMRARMLPVDNLFKKFPRMVRDIAVRAGKDAHFIIHGEDTELDRSVIEEIGDPLMHLLRNAVDHGIEPPMERLKAGKAAQGAVVLEASHEENHIIISVRDDGRGIDAARLRAAAIKKGLMSEEAARRISDQAAINLIFHAGFSTAEKVSDISGRGVGMDVVHKNIERLNGTVDVRTEVGKGTEFRIKLPLTLAIVRALLIDLFGTVYAIPLGSVTETIRIPSTFVQTVQRNEVVVFRGSVVPLLRLENVFGLRRLPQAPSGGELFVVIVNLFGKQVGIVVDSLVGEQEVVIKSLGKYIGEVPGVSGATILGDGAVAIILDVASLVNSVILAQPA